MAKAVIIFKPLDGIYLDRNDHELAISRSPYPLGLGIERVEAHTGDLDVSEGMIEFPYQGHRVTVPITDVRRVVTKEEMED